MFSDMPGVKAPNIADTPAPKLATKTLMNLPLQV